MRNHMRFTRGFIGVALLAALAACGGGSFGGGSGGTGGSSGATNGNSLVELGSGVGTNFKNQTLDIQAANLSAGGSTQVTANIVDANNANALYAQSVTVTFTSNCASAGTASITQSVTTTNGTAIAAYLAQGCSGKDIITATAAVGTNTLTATATITVQAPTIGSITFVSATPSAISLQGVGGNTTSKVIFQVNDANGNPVANTTVDFSLSTTAGGVSLSPASGITDSSGQAFTDVLAGTVHTSVNVTATVASNGLQQTTPNAIAVSTGVPTQSHLSLSMTTHNLSRSFDHDGVADAVNVFAVDRYGNPASPGTSILFTTNSGTISGGCPPSTNGTTACGSCQTDVNGHCSVTWTSEGARPDPTNNSLYVLGHAHILAYTAGEEDYTDNNQDGVFDDGDKFTNNTTDSFFGANDPVGFDIGDPYMDTNENGGYDIGEPFEDIANGSSVTRRAPNTNKWYGAGCGGFSGSTASITSTSGAIACANKLTMVGQDGCIVMSTDHATVGTPSQATVLHTGDLVTITVADSNGNVIGSGSTITIGTINVAGVTLTLSPSTGTGGNSFTQPDVGCNGAAVETFTITVTPNPGATTFGGQFYLIYTSEDSKTSDQSSFITIN
jgi:hypothetical protein